MECSKRDDTRSTEDAEIRVVWGEGGGGGRVVRRRVRTEMPSVYGWLCMDGRACVLHRGGGVGGGAREREVRRRGMRGFKEEEAEEEEGVSVESGERGGSSGVWRCLYDMSSWYDMSAETSLAPKRRPRRDGQVVTSVEERVSAASKQEGLIGRSEAMTYDR